MIAGLRWCGGVFGVDRRGFIGAFAGSTVIAQPVAKAHLIGFFLGASGQLVASRFGALRDGLHNLG
jgi:hypothetical protein